MSKDFREEAGELGYGGVKYLGAIAVAIVLGLEVEEQKALVRYAREKTWHGPEGLEPLRVLHMLRMMKDLPAPNMARYLQTLSVDASFDRMHKEWLDKEEEDSEFPSLIDAICEQYGGDPIPAGTPFPTASEIRMKMDEQIMKRNKELEVLKKKRRQENMKRKKDQE
jgi:hypothetical protein